MKEQKNMAGETVYIRDFKEFGLHEAIAVVRNFAYFSAGFAPLENKTSWPAEQLWLADVRTS